MSMRIAMLITSFHPIVGGAEKQLAQVAERMARRGHEVHVVTRFHPGLARRERLFESVVHRVGRPGPKAWAAGSFLVEALLLLRRIRPDVLHAHSTYSPAIVAALAKSRLRVPLAVKPMQGGEFTGILAKPLGGARVAWLVRSVDRFVAISTEIHAELIRLGVPPDRIAAIPNGVDVGRFTPATPAEKALARSRLGLPSGVVALFAGRLVPQKRVPLLLDAWNAAETGDATLVLAGRAPNPLPDEIASRIGPRTRLLGVCDDMESLFKAADLFVLPSASEGLSNALLEAGASGLPIVASRVGGTEDVLVDGVNGVLIPGDDLAALAAAFDRLLADNVLRERLGTAARTTVESNYGLAASVTGLLELYEELRRDLAA